MLTSWSDTLVRTLNARGLDGEELARRCGIDPADLRDPDRRIPHLAWTRLWRAAVDATGDPALGLDVSHYVRPGTFNALGQAVLTSSTLHDALERIARFSHVVADFTVVTMVETPTEVGVVITWDDAVANPSDESIDAIMASIVRSARFMLNRSVAPLRLALRRPEPADRGPFDRVFQCPIEFSAPQNILVFDRSTAQLPVAGGNDRLAESHDRVAAAYLANLDPDTTAIHVRRVLPGLLPGGEPTIITTAAAMATSARTLQRHLQDEGTTFREVLRDVRHGLAVDYLRAGGHTVTEIAYLLGFTEVATFSRAFKQWTGISPSHFR